MKQDCFNYTFSEWRRQERIYLEMLSGGDIFSCPACTDSPHVVHIDGNSKLYRYKKQSRDGRLVHLLLAQCCQCLFLNFT